MEHGTYSLPRYQGAPLRSRPVKIIFKHVGRDSCCLIAFTVGISSLDHWYRNNCLQDPTLLFGNLLELWKCGLTVEGLKHQHRPCGTQREKPSGECFSLHPYQCTGKISPSPGQTYTGSTPPPQQAQSPSALLLLTTKPRGTNLVPSHPSTSMPFSWAPSSWLGTDIQMFGLDKPSMKWFLTSIIKITLNERPTHDFYLMKLFLFEYSSMQVPPKPLKLNY